MSSLRAVLRQLTFPRELRIADPGLRPLAVSLAELQALLRDNADEPRPQAAEPGSPKELDPQFVRKLANATWRLELQTLKLAADDVGDWIRTRMELLVEVLSNEGVETIDYTGQPFDPREVWDAVIGSQEEKLHPVIASMREPRILYRGAVIARGTPVVGELESQ
jgi:hypothetical protein